MLRHIIPQHFTASAVVLAADHVLLIHHKKIGAWLPPGGHLEPHEMPHEAAVRETLEETGVEVSLCQGETAGNADAFMLPAPLCLHGVKAVEQGQEVYHIDIAYLCRPANFVAAPPGSQPESILPALESGHGVVGARWVPLADLSNWHLAANVPEILALALRHLQTAP